MRSHFRRIKSRWNRTDTLLLATNSAALILLLGNLSWKAVWPVWIAAGTAIAAQTVWSFTKPETPLKQAVTLGAIAAWGWAPIERIVTRLVGWWGTYDAPGIQLFDTPVYAILIAWLGATHCAYVAARVPEFGYGTRVSVAVTGLSALLLGVIGENLFVGAGLWSYRNSAWDWWSVPAFIPISYAVGYGILPYLRTVSVPLQAAAVLAALVTASLGLGYATGFFPAPDYL